MDSHLHKQLVNFGLSEKEAKIYLALLELEMATVFEVSKQSGINRSSAYVVFGRLKEKRFLLGSPTIKKSATILRHRPKLYSTQPKPRPKNTKKQKLV